MSNKTFVRTETILEIVNDTVVKVQPDSASIKALLECDSVGNVLLKRIAEYEAGKHVNPPKLDIQDNVLTAMVKVDSFGIFMTFRERYVERTDFMESQEREIVYVNRLTGWQKFRVRLGDFVLIGIPIYVVFKCRKSIWSWIRKIFVQEVDKGVEYPSFIVPYLKSSSQRKCFYVASDGMVFLGKEYKAATAHQRGVKNGELQTIKVK